MKIFFIFAVLLLSPFSGFAATQTNDCTGTNTQYMGNFAGDHCKRTIRTCMYEYEYEECAECEAGYETACNPNSPSGVCAHMCELDCSKLTCSNCDNGPWSAKGTGYMTRTARWCDCGTCKSRTDYACAANYYGTPTSNGTSGCSPCPAPGTSGMGSTSVTNCSITSFSNSTGSGHFQPEKCYYKTN